MRVRGRIGGFDGPYPVVVLGDFEMIESEDQDGSKTYQEEILRRDLPDLPSQDPKTPNRRY